VKYTVTYMDGEATYTTQNVAYGSATSAPTAPQKEHYTFSKWTTDTAGQNEYDFTTPISGALTLYAQWTPVNYTVTYMNGETQYTTQTVAYGSTTTAPTEDPQKDHYDFAGWTTDAAGQNAYNFTTPISGALTLYAQWTPVKYTVTYMDGETTYTTQNVAYGSATSAPTAPQKEHYTFSKWTTDTAGANEYDFTTPISGALTLYAQWTPVNYIVTYMNDETQYTTQTVAYGNTASAPTDPQKEHYEFGGWTTDAAGQNAYDFTTPISGALILYAQWTPVNYTVTFMDGQTHLSTQTVAYGSAASVPDEPQKEHYTFSKWTTDTAGQNAYDFTTPISGVLILYAQWTPVNYTVTFMDGQTQLSTQTVAYGSAASAPDEPQKEHYTFSKWTTDTAGQNAYDFTTSISGALILYAQWTPVNYTVTFMDGQTQLSTQNVAYNTSVAKPDDPTKTSYEFAGWFSDSDLTKRYDFTTPISGALTLYAQWTLVDITIPVSEPDTAFTIDETGYTLTTEYSNRTLSSVTVTAKEGYAFVGNDPVSGEEVTGVTFTYPTCLADVWAIAPEFSTAAAPPESITVRVYATRVYSLNDLASFDWTGLTEAAFAPESTGTTGVIAMPAGTVIPAGKTVTLYALGYLEQLTYSDLTVNGTLIVNDTVPFYGAEGATLTVAAGGCLKFSGMEVRFYVAANSTLTSSGTILSDDPFGSGDSSLYMTVEAGALFMNNASGTLSDIEIELLGTIVNYGTLTGEVDLYENGVIYSETSPDLTVLRYHDDTGETEAVDPTPLSSYNP